MTHVCDVHVACLRKHGYTNLPEWVANPQNVYIGRAGVIIIDGLRYPRRKSMWANPYKVGKDGNVQEVLNKYYDYIVDKIKSKHLWGELINLKGKCLGCWCTNTFDHEKSTWICHGQILMHLIDLKEKGLFP